jgi:hypothetical protein
MTTAAVNAHTLPKDYLCEAVIDGMTCGGKTDITKTFHLPNGSMARYHKCRTCGFKTTTAQPGVTRFGEPRPPKIKSTVRRSKNKVSA